MKRRQWYALIPVLAVLSLLATLLLGGAANSRPSFGGTCDGCHDPGASTSVSVTVQSETAGDITYAVSGATGAGGNQGWGAFAGTTKIASGSGAGQFTVPKDGTTYTVYWVAVADGYARTTVTAPVAQTTTTVAQTTSTLPPTTSTLPPTTSTTVPQSTTTTVPNPTTSTTAPPTTGTTLGPDEDGCDDEDEDEEHDGIHERHREGDDQTGRDARDRGHERRGHRADRD